MLAPCFSLDGCSLFLPFIPGCLSQVSLAVDYQDLELAHALSKQYGLEASSLPLGESEAVIRRTVLSGRRENQNIQEVEQLGKQARRSHVSMPALH